MAYTALYREFRPKKFEGIVGQEHITKTLRNQIISNRVGHAYLFNGGRGTGKTSAAKILARAVNCLNTIDGEPCNECEICKGILSGAVTDVVEMDAASNNSVEDIRIIREEVNFLPTIAKYRVYIIDEVHMLSTGAFNALLKTLEEPPEHVKFILATTEPQKLPATILSRCQRFDFKRISNENIIKGLKIVCSQANINITEEALNIVANLSEGAMRDALSILERCVQDGVVNIDGEYIREIVGIPKLTFIKQVIDGILKYDIEQVLNVINAILSEGKDIINFIYELIKFTKDLLIYKTSNKLEMYSEEDLKDIEQLSKLSDSQRLITIIYSLSELINEIKNSTQQLIIFQAGLIKLCNKEQGNSNSDIERRIIELENRVKNIGNNYKNPIINNAPNTRNEVKINPTQVQNNVSDKQITKQNEKVTINKGELSKNWVNILNTFRSNGKIMLYTTLMNTNAVEINDLTIGIEFPNGMTPFGKQILENVDNKRDLVNQLSIILGKEINVKYIDLKSSNTETKKDNSVETLMNDFDIPFNVIE